MGYDTMEFLGMAEGQWLSGKVDGAGSCMVIT